MKQIRALVARFFFLCFAFSIPALAQSTDFTLIVMPDVQNETEYYPQVLASETQWIVNQQSALNIQGVLGLGDITNNGSDQTQWANADAAYELLDEAGIPYFLAIGNHDYENASPNTARSAIGFNQWFGPARYANYPWYQGNYQGSNENFYGTLTINGKQYLILVLEFVPRDAAVEWAKDVIAGNPDKEVILVTHSYLYSDNTRVDQCDTKDMVGDNYGDKVWTKLVSQYANFNMVLSGHVTNGKGARRADLGISGNLVNQIFSNYQLLANGGDGYLRIMTFHPSTDTMDVKTYSPYLQSYMTDSGNQFTIPWHVQANSATTGSISGLVRDVGTCKPIAGATVTAAAQTATTDSTGHYSLTVPAGSYGVNGSATKYTPGSVSTVVNNGYSADTNLFLTAAPTSSCTINQTSPSVTICTPSNNATVTSPVSISASGTDTKAISLMQLYIDGKGSTQQSGATFNTSATLATGTHRLTVQAKDSAGTLFKQTINITVSSGGGGNPGPCTLNPTSPSVTICAPLNGATVTSPVTVTAGSTDTTSVSNIELFVDGIGQTTQQGGTLNATAALTPGSHRLAVQAIDAAGTTFKQIIYVTASDPGGNPGPCTLNSAPSVTICTPSNGATVSSPLTVTAGTTDTKSVSYIQLYVDGSAKITQTGGTLNATATLTAGSHRLTVQARDSAGVVFKQTITVIVSN
jgi:nitrogen fixation protein FixH